MTSPGGWAGRGRGSPQVLREHNENIQELIDQVQGEQLRGPWGPRLAWRPAPRLRSFVSQVGHPQGVQQGDYVGEQLSLQKPKTRYRMLTLSQPLLSLTSAGGVGGNRRPRCGGGGSVQRWLSRPVPSSNNSIRLSRPLQYLKWAQKLSEKRVTATNPAPTRGQGQFSFLTR